MEDNVLMENDIRKLIKTSFPSLKVDFYEDQDDIVVSINDESVYYSNEYQEMVLKINTNYLWPRDIMNVLFVCKDAPIYQSHFYSAPSNESQNNSSWLDFHINENQNLRIINSVKGWSYHDMSPSPHQGVQFPCELQEAA